MWPDVERMVRTVGRGYFTNEADAADLAQDVALAAFLERGELKDAQHLTAWSLRRARWTALDRLERLAVERRGRRRWFQFRSPSPDPLSTLVAAEVVEQIRSLPPQQSDVMLRALAGESSEDIAKAMKITPATVRSLKRFARGRLADLLLNEDITRRQP